MTCALTRLVLRLIVSGMKFNLSPPLMDCAFEDRRWGLIPVICEQFSALLMSFRAKGALDCTIFDEAASQYKAVFLPCSTRTNSIFASHEQKQAQRLNDRRLRVAMHSLIARLAESRSATWWVWGPSALTCSAHLVQHLGRMIEYVSSILKQLTRL